MKRGVLFCLVLMCCSVASVAKSRVYLLGDGSMAVAADSAIMGWGEALNEYLAQGVTLQNEAKEGMSLKIFLENGGEEKISELPAKSIVFLQFGGNDLIDTNLEQYSSLDLFVRRYNSLIKKAINEKLQVVLCTPLARPYYHEGRWIDRLGGYDDAVRRLAKLYHLPLLDLEEQTREWWMSMSEVEASIYYFDSVENEAFLLTEDGAKKVAEMAANMMRNQKDSKIKKLIKK
jgi:lysophospholipase L1-like esterase